jgi:hypothetical protein
MRVYIMLLLLVVYQSVHAEETLCTEKEKIVFSCHAKEKIISLCNSSQAEKNLIYRFGRIKHVELVYPENGKKTKNDFYRSTQMLFGGGEKSISFKRMNYEFKIYSKIGRSDSNDHQESRIPIYEDGLMLFQKDKLVKQFVCDDGGEGFREDISWISEKK